MNFNIGAAESRHKQVQLLEFPEVLKKSNTESKLQNTSEETLGYKEKRTRSLDHGHHLKNITERKEVEMAKDTLEQKYTQEVENGNLPGIDNLAAKISNAMNPAWLK
ncbi:hypothetical protein HHI36_015127 [Cryptolaemus montrouzieri]|uniref:Uncharacterized protein n=1 Tax=Cryptolaemus montrouzieri TaxID=559131 RepID=A0ABD2N564_9CUCU